MVFDTQLVIDESGYGQRGRTETFVFAGFLGSVPEWSAFSRLWTLAMGDWTARRLKSQRGSKDNPHILRLVEAIERSRIKRAQLRIPHDDFDLVITQQLPQWISNGELQPDARWKLSNPYFFAFFAFLFQTFATLRAHQPDARLEVIYDKNLEHRARLVQGYRDLLASPIQPENRKFLCREPRPENDDDFMPLQAADLIAWHTHRAYVAEHSGGEHKDVVWAALRALPIAFDETWDSGDLTFAVRGV